ncbi:MAG: hypothetical protein HOG94_14895 [Nitrospinaceae bacterium]|nr:hypothetical protein [Nitrospinaceae bacterium]
MRTARLWSSGKTIPSWLFVATFLVLAGPLAGDALAAYGEAFGLRLGMSQEQVLSLGTELEESGISETWGPRYRVKKLPRPFGDERWVWLYFGNNNRLFQIIAELADGGGAYDSKNALRRYKEIKENLSSRYAKVTSREQLIPEGEPCFNPPTLTNAGDEALEAKAREAYETALDSSGHHSLISMMHFCTIKNWTAEYDKSDTYVTLTLSPKDARPETSWAFIHIKVESKSLAEDFRRARSAPLAGRRESRKTRSAATPK